MKRKTLYAILGYVFIFLSSDWPSTQTGEVSGVISMPVVQKESRAFRGKMYRSRLSEVKESGKSKEILKSSFIDVIISAHPLSFKPQIKPLQDVKILQRDATFIPRVVPVTPGTLVQFINKDNFFHNVFSITPGAYFNIGRRATNVIVEKKISRLGEIKLFCDIHAQMNAIILSLDTAYFTRCEPNGRYSLSGLPDGEYAIKVYHPDLPELTDTIVIKKAERIRRDFNLSR